MTIQEAWNLIQDGGVAALLIIIIMGGVKRWWVFGWVFHDLNMRHETLRNEKNEWKELALHSTNLADSLNEMRKHSWKGPEQ